MAHGGRGDQGVTSGALARELAAALDGVGAPARVASPPPGMLVDGTMTGKTTDEILQAGRDNKIYLKKIGEIHGKTGYFRVTPGTDEESERFLKFIREYFGK